MGPGSARIVLLGRDHEGIGLVAARTADLGPARLEAVISRGGPAAGSKPNEDAVLVLAEGGPALVLVADAHYGPAASELAAAAAERVYSGTAWRGLGEPQLREVLLRMVRASQAAIAQEGGDSETTLLLGLLSSGVLYWGNVGDSYLYRFPAGRGAAVLNTPTRIWLGARLGVPVHEVTQLGRCSVEPGTRVLLATDGIPEPIRGVLAFGPPRIRAVLDGGGERPLEGLARAALEYAGEDNIAGVLITGAG